VALPSRERVRAYQVFARHDKEPALTHVGEVQADNDSDAVIFAHTLYDERRWQEMIVVPQSAIVTLISAE
jgi:1,2-phenylacetyl-CoA epoxidase PaaB subunit